MTRGLGRGRGVGVGRGGMPGVPNKRPGPPPQVINKRTRFDQATYSEANGYSA